MLLTLLALAAPLPAFAISDQALEPVSADPGPAALSVSASLDSCGVMSDQVVCKLDVSFNPLPNADSYSATITRADGSVVDYGEVGPGGASIWVPYVGAGNYSVKITAYGEPNRPDDPDGHGHGHRHVIDTDVSSSSPWSRVGRDKPDRAEPKKEEPAQAATTVTGRGDLTSPQNADADGAATTEARSSAAAPAPACPAPPPAPPTPPEQPPPDLDPNNPDEDADGIPDEQEQTTYEQELAEYQAAVEAQANAPPPPEGC